MKFFKLFNPIFLGLFVIVSTFSACLKDGPIVDDPDLNRLVVVPSSNNINLGDTVHFDIIYLGEIIEADLYVNEEKIQGVDYVFNEEDTYEIIAKKVNYKNSYPIVITIAGDIPNNSYNVYVVGGYVVDGNMSAVLWTNDSVDFINFGNGEATSVFVYEDVPYITSTDYYNEINLWQYDQKTNLYSDNNATNFIYSTSIYVENGITYVAGNIASQALYWKGMTINELSDTSEAYEVLDLVVDNGEILAVGNYYENGSYKANIWANGDRWSLSNEANSTARAITVSNGDYYATGYSGNLFTEKACIWDNSGMVKLQSPQGFSSGNDILIYNGKTYVVGENMSDMEWNYAMFWIDGNMKKINDDDHLAVANSIAVAPDGSIYIAGWIQHYSDQNRSAVYWKFDTSGNLVEEVRLTDGSKNGEAMGIAIGASTTSP